MTIHDIDKMLHEMMEWLSHSGISEDSVWPFLFLSADDISEIAADMAGNYRYADRHDVIPGIAELRIVFSFRAFTLKLGADVSTGDIVIMDTDGHKHSYLDHYINAQIERKVLGKQ